VSDLLIRGLEISLIGMGLTFAALGLLIGTMVLLERLFRPASATVEKRPRLPPSPTREVSEEEEIAAAIAIALAYFERGESEGNSLGATLELGRSQWWGRRNGFEHRLHHRSKRRR
jgi:Na+-transporting methylmalonyl-CoA/oxaloacetate decarboxylase gamma subunit